MGDEQNAGLRLSHMHGFLDYAMNTLNSGISRDHRQQLPSIFDTRLFGVGDSSNNEQILLHETFEDKTTSTRTIRDCTSHKLDWPSYGMGHAAKNEESQDYARMRSHICKAEAPQLKSRSRNAPRNADEDTEKQRSRGRPRLDSCDENAGDRRRTQIRRAQRAYRLRKETTISSLKQQVESLERTVEEMNDSFLRFNGTALRSGLVQLRPNLAAELQATTHEFSSLVRTARHEPEANVIDSSEEALIGQASNFLLSPISKFGRTNNVPEVAVFEESQSHSHFHNEPRQNCGSADHESVFTLPAEHLNVLELAVGDTHSLNTQQFHDMLPDLNVWGSGPSVVNVPMQCGPMVQDLLRTQNNLTMYERSFGRHLRRQCLEFAYHLLANFQAPEKVRARVFRYSFLYLNREQVMHQVHKLLMAMNTQALETIESLRNRSQRIIRGPDGQGELVYRPAFGPYPICQPTGNVGPVAIETASLSATPQSIVELASIEGEWWGPEDIEQYLREKGVRIDQRTSYAEVGIDEISSEHLILPKSPESMISHGGGQSDTASSAASRQFPTAPPSHSSENFIPTANDINGSFDSLGGLHNPQIFHQDLTQGEGYAMHIPPSPYSSKDAPLETQADLYDDGYGYARSGIDGYRIPQMLDTGTAGYFQRKHRKHRRVMTLDMSVLLKEISNKGVCLGFSPAFKKTDVDYAISVAMQAA